MLVPFCLLAVRELSYEQVCRCMFLFRADRQCRTVMLLAVDRVDGVDLVLEFGRVCSVSLERDSSCCVEMVHQCCWHHW